MAKIRVLKPLTGAFNMAYRPGAEITLPDGLASEMVEMGFGELIEGKLIEVPEKKIEIETTSMVMTSEGPKKRVNRVK